MPHMPWTVSSRTQVYVDSVVYQINQHVVHIFQFSGM